ncbi:hypothetical protein KAH37_01285 [bacterium]|nr:hypothetical protein [bacterium]
MRYFFLILSIFFVFSCSSKTTPAITDDDCRGDDSSRPDSDGDLLIPDGDVAASDDDDSSIPDGDGDTSDDDDSSIPDGDGDASDDDDSSIPDGDDGDSDDGFELPDSDATFLSCSSHGVCAEAVDPADLGYCYYNYCWQIGEIAWDITLYDFEIDPAYFEEKFPGVDVSTIQYRIDVEYQSSGNHKSYTGTEDFIRATKLKDVALTMFTGTPYSYRMHFFEKNPKTLAVYELAWYVSSKVTHGEIGTGDFIVQLEMYQGPIKVKVQGRFLAYIE